MTLVSSRSPSSTVSPADGATFLLTLDSRGNVEVEGNCGKWKGEYALSGQALSITSKRNIFSRCRDDEVFQLFINDLLSSSVAHIQEGTLRVIMQGETGVMVFQAD